MKWPLNYWTPSGQPRASRFGPTFGGVAIIGLIADVRDEKKGAGSADRAGRFGGRRILIGHAVVVA